MSVIEPEILFLSDAWKGYFLPRYRNELSDACHICRETYADTAPRFV